MDGETLKDGESNRQTPQSTDMCDFAIGERVSWRGVNRIETGVIKAKDEGNIIICLASGKAIVAELSSLSKTTDGD